MLLLEEYYPNALEDTYRGVSGYIYRAAAIPKAPQEIGIPDAAASSLPVPVEGAEFVPDALEAILAAERAGLLALTRYGELTGQKRAWIRRTMREQYDSAGDHPEYRYFLKNKFPFLLEK